MKKFNRSIEDEILAARVTMLDKFRFYGVLCMKLKIVLDDREVTMSVDGDRLWINPRFVENTLKYKEYLRFVLAHEVLHCALGHLWRRGNRQMHLWNYACDYVVNGILWQYILANGNKNAFILMPKSALFNAEYLNKSAEQVYVELLEKSAKKPASPSIAGSGNKGGADTGKKTDTNGADGDTEGADSADELTDILDNMIENEDAPAQTDIAIGDIYGDIMESLSEIIAEDGGKLLDDHSKWERTANGDAKLAEWMIATRIAVEQDKSCGAAPAGIVGVIEDFFAPKKSWQQELAEFAEPEVRDFSFSPPDNKYHEYDFFLPDEHYVDEVVKNVYFYSDNSGSVDDELAKEFASELIGCYRQFGDGTEIWYGSFDTEASDPILLEDDSQVKTFGRGGTDPSCIFRKLDSMDLLDTIKVIVILTDGYFGTVSPELAKGVPVIWAVCKTGSTRSIEDAGWEKILTID